MLKKIISVCMAAVILLFFTACWDHLEISKLLIIAGIGLDLNDDGKTYHATVECINVEAEGDKNISSKIVESDGDTVYNAIQNAMLFTGGVMFGNHCKAVVVGDKLARSGAGEVIEMILRSPDFRKTVDIMVARNASAESVMKQKTVSNDVISYELSKILKSNADAIKNTVAAGVYQFHESLVSGCPYYILPAVYSKDNNGEAALLVDGCAVFAGDRLRGFLSGDQSKLFNLIADKAESAIITLENPVPGQGPIDVKITRSSSSFKPSLKGDTLSVHVSIDVQATLEDAVLMELSPADGQTAEQMRRDISGRLSAEAEKLVEDVQSIHGADIFGFYREFEDGYRREWAGLEKDWDSLFRDMEVTVAADVRLTGSGLVGDYLPKASEEYNANALP